MLTTFFLKVNEWLIAGTVISSLEQGGQFQEFIESQGAEPVFIERLVRKMIYLNRQIESDAANLGPGYRIDPGLYR